MLLAKTACNVSSLIWPDGSFIHVRCLLISYLIKQEAFASQLRNRYRITSEGNFRVTSEGLSVLLCIIFLPIWHGRIRNTSHQKGLALGKMQSCIILISSIFCRFPSVASTELAPAFFGPSFWLVPSLPIVAHPCPSLLLSVSRP